MRQARKFGAENFSDRLVEDKIETEIDDEDACLGRQDDE